jgi:hypothetical protein
MLQCVNTRFLICPDRIFGRGRSFPIATLEGAGEEWGEEYSVENMVRTRRMGESIHGLGE